MSENTAPTGAAENPAEPPESATQPTAPPEPDQAADVDQGAEDGALEPSPNSEAARYRMRLRETEAERDQLAERLTGYQRKECEAAVADLLDVPADLWDVGLAAAGQFYTEAGELDEGQIRAAAGALLEERPRLAKAPETPSFWGQTSGPATPSSGPSWADVIGRG
jgi:hypothetical protein